MGVWTALLLVVLLLAGTEAGFRVQGRLKEHHRSRDTVESMRLVLTMMVTFAALVLGLLVTSAKGDFDSRTGMFRQYGTDLIQLDQRLRQYGSEADSIRQLLRTYTAAAIAATWPKEPPPSGDYPHDLKPVAPGSAETGGLTVMTMRINSAIGQLVPPDPAHARLASILRNDIQSVINQRWRLIAGTRSAISYLFMAVLLFWLLSVFVLFGLCSPRHGLTYFAILLAALSVVSALWVIAELETPLGGLITVSSQPLRDALWHMDQPNR